MFFDKEGSVNVESSYYDVYKIATAEKSKSSPAEIRIFNKSDVWIAFELSPSNPETFCIKSCSSTLLGPGERQRFEIGLQPNYDDDKKYYYIHFHAAVCAWKPTKGTKLNFSAKWKDVKQKDITIRCFP